MVNKVFKIGTICVGGAFLFQFAVDLIDYARKPELIPHPGVLWLLFLTAFGIVNWSAKK